MDEVVISVLTFPCQWSLLALAQHPLETNLKILDEFGDAFREAVELVGRGSWNAAEFHTFSGCFAGMEWIGFWFTLLGKSAFHESDRRKE